MNDNSTLYVTKKMYRKYFIYSNGRKYDGDWLKNKKHGQGVLFDYFNQNKNTFLQRIKNTKKLGFFFLKF